MLRILPGNLDDPRVIDLLLLHITTARAQTARGSAHALDVTALRGPDIHVWTAWEGEELLAIGALRRLSTELGEVKSMHTASEARRRGAGSVMLRHIVDSARAMNLSRLALETGSWDYFIPARAFYRRHGFMECAPFGTYVADPNSVFMSLDLKPG